MSFHQSLVSINLSDLLAGCCQEQARFGEANGCCFELFRRAIELGDDQAWFGIQRQFRPLFMRWILESAAFEVDQFVIEDLLQIALERFWGALTDSTLPLTARFSSTGSLLKYMKRCIQTACLEWQRGEIRQQRIHKRLSLSRQGMARQRPLEALWSQKVEASRCTAVRLWLEEHCRDEAERLVYQLTYEENLKPRQIAAQHPDHFPQVQDVYRIKLRLYRRIQRALGAQGLP